MASERANACQDDQCPNGSSKRIAVSASECEVDDENTTTGDVSGESGTISSTPFLVGTLLSGAKCNLNFVVNKQTGSSNNNNGNSNNSSSFVSGSDNRNRSSSSSSSDAWSEKNRRHSSRDGLLPTSKHQHQHQHQHQHRLEHHRGASYIRSESLMSEERKKEKKKHKRVTSSYSLTDEPSLINGYVSTSEVLERTHCQNCCPNCSSCPPTGSLLMSCQRGKRKRKALFLTRLFSLLKVIFSCPSVHCPCLWYQV